MRDDGMKINIVEKIEEGAVLKLQAEEYGELFFKLELEDLEETLYLFSISKSRFRAKRDSTVYILDKVFEYSISKDCFDLVEEVFSLEISKEKLLDLYLGVFTFVYKNICLKLPERLYRFDHFLYSLTLEFQTKIEDIFEAEYSDFTTIPNLVSNDWFKKTFFINNNIKTLATYKVVLENSTNNMFFENLEGSDGNLRPESEYDISGELKIFKDNNCFYKSYGDFSLMIDEVYEEFRQKIISEEKESNELSIDGESVPFKVLDKYFVELYFSPSSSIIVHKNNFFRELLLARYKFYSITSDLIGASGGNEIYTSYGSYYLEDIDSYFKPMEIVVYLDLNGKKVKLGSVDELEQLPDNSSVFISLVIDQVEACCDVPMNSTREVHSVIRDLYLDISYGVSVENILGSSFDLVVKKGNRNGTQSLESVSLLKSDVEIARVTYFSVLERLKLLISNLEKKGINVL